MTADTDLGVVGPHPGYGAVGRCADDPWVIVARFAAGLSAAGALTPALQRLVDDLGLRSAVVRDSAGALLAVAGAVVQAVPQPGTEGTGPATFELPVPGWCDGPPAWLSVVGASPGQLPALRTAAGVLGLAIGARAGEALVEQAEATLDEVADALHDGPVQSLVVARYAADAAVRGGDPALTRDAVQAALLALRRTLWHLRPRGGQGLGPALTALSGRLEEAGDLPFGTHCDPDVELSAAAATTAYRLVQSVARPMAARAHVAVRRQAGRVVVTVDGGAPLADPDRWARRVQAIGGHVSCSPGRLRLSLPQSRQPPYPKANS